MKYLFLDFGYVLCYPTTGDWFITPYFNEYIKEHNLNRRAISGSVKYFGDILDRKVLTLREEVEMYYDFYKGIFDRLEYRVPLNDIDTIANDITYSTTKYRLFKDIREELDKLKEIYNLILLTDNWPCGEYLMNHWGLTEYFKNMYISSYYGIKKDKKEFFRIPMDEYNIDPSNILFVDDSNTPLDTAISMGIDSYKMDRYNNIQEDDYKVIHDLKCLCRQ